jgi:hypothetical protein
LLVRPKVLRLGEKRLDPLLVVAGAHR